MEETKICTRCDKEKPLSAFDKQTVKGKVYYKPYCCGCKSKGYRKRHPDAVQSTAKEAKNRYRANQLYMKQQILEHIGQTVCKHCGYTDIRALSFHHRDKKDKSFGIAQGFTHNYSLETLKKEAEKCDVLCMNCHTIEHCSLILPQDLIHVAVRA